MTSSCAVDGCLRSRQRREWCDTHYRRVQRTGSPRGDVAVRPPPGRPLRDRLLDYVDQSGDCWLWTASKSPNGYGKFSVDCVMRMAHRVAYEVFVGPIPEGLHVDHLCKVRHCVRPDHLEAVTQAENNRRAFGGKCRAGLHDMPPPTGRDRKCKPCRRAHDREKYRARQQVIPVPAQATS